MQILKTTFLLSLIACIVGQVTSLINTDISIQYWELWPLHMAALYMLYGSTVILSVISSEIKGKSNTVILRGFTPRFDCTSIWLIHSSSSASPLIKQPPSKVTTAHVTMNHNYQWPLIIVTMVTSDHCYHGYQWPLTMYSVTRVTSNR